MLNEAHDNAPIAKTKNEGIDRVLAIGSGKGGVGKSSVTALLAVALRRQGFKLGILDADLTGPSIPKLLGVDGKPKAAFSGLIPPVSPKLGIRVMSINLLLDDPYKPVIWRGPIIANVIKQFWEEVMWGEIDYLLVDLPPGTSDAPLTIMQLLPLNGFFGCHFTPVPFGHGGNQGSKHGQYVVHTSFRCAGKYELCYMSLLPSDVEALWF